MSDKAVKYQKTREEIEDALREQIEFLRRSCELYDQGHYSEATRVASTVFIIANDGGQKSLLTQLSIKKDLQCVSYAYPLDNVPAGNSLDEMPLVMMRFGENGIENVPKLNNGPFPSRAVKFSEWWEKDIVFKTPTGQSLTRRTLTFAMRNQDGGGHVDPRLSDEAYVNMSRRSDLKSRHNGVDQDILPRRHLPTMRHIGFELHETLRLSAFNTPSTVNCHLLP